MVQLQGVKTFSFTTAAIRQAALNNGGTSNANCGQLATLCRHGLLKEALDVLYDTNHKQLKLSCSTYASLLQLCLYKRSLPDAKRVQDHLKETGFSTNVFLSHKLVVLYAKLGSLQDARSVLDNMEVKNVASWTNMIQAYSKHGDEEEAFGMFFKMQGNGIQPDHFTFATVLPVCANLLAFEEGKQMHGHIIKRGYESDVFVGSALVDMYARCGYIENAREVFDKMPKRNVVSWTAIVAGYAQIGDVYQAVELFEIMPEQNVYSWSVMITAYAHAGCMDKALDLFVKTPIQNVVLWNAMIAGYGYNRQFCEALTFYREMQLRNARANHVTFASLFSASANLAALHKGKEIHGRTVRCRLPFDIFVWNSLVDMYAKCGSVKDARNMFDKMTTRNVISWTTMIVGYVHNRKFCEAIKVYREMQLREVRTNHVTLASLLSACANLTALHTGKEMHGRVVRGRLPFDIFVWNGLIDMYGKCGYVKDAWKLFDTMSIRNVVSWTTMIVGYAKHGYAKEALQLFHEMQQSDIKPNNITFVGVLHACCRAGLVDDGMHYFNCMTQDYNLVPTIEHYNCMVALLGQAGRLDEAISFINSLTMEPEENIPR